ncbi:hypothetical protein GCM10007989_14610 [Devosia pacifica]|uniref:Uncharacterized protein n=1 Tax=Devosia pacifica TaxID=1335967 RepID=A0A918VQY8_9HYPH|nr:hypothetical protein [Devosia pacifica]GHA20581.1 hypothetical protein GCM10007989_14610 [Devosia pacifica]
MATASNKVRRDMIAGIIGQELERQSQEGAARVDVDSIADAIDRALDETHKGGFSEGIQPDNLDSSNDG